MLDFFIFTPLLNKKSPHEVGNKKRRKNAPLIAEYYIIK